ncbi:desumoylating isopeptidase 2-like isoform X3 [Orbicella faveolata]|uniref:desumoylating isopeptidase 2-like isoform X3 n=1 Tax=Orbicella faveolata TaxID=48498 RepID=UPI0009E25E95|nr:desumoylating isopeptidase 2-like isoform X3 [Orbicella faveolata]
MSGYPVVLNVYDMYWINQYTFPVGLGVFHSGVVVHGKEYAFGGHPNNWSGIFEMSPKSVEVLGDDFKFRNCNHFTSEFCQTALGQMKMINQGLRLNTDDKYSILHSRMSIFCSSTRISFGILRQQLCLEEGTLSKVPKAEKDTKLSPSIKKLVIFITN